MTAQMRAGPPPAAAAAGLGAALGLPQKTKERQEKPKNNVLQRADRRGTDLAGTAFYSFLEPPEIHHRTQPHEPETRWGSPER